MSYNLIKKINGQILREVNYIHFPYRFGTVGAFLSSLMIPVYGTDAIEMVSKSFTLEELSSVDYNLQYLKEYFEGLKDPILTEVSTKVIDFINQEYIGITKSFFESEVWQIDNQLSSVLDEYEEFRDSILLFVFSVPVFPISELMAEVMIDFHIFEPDESYMEMQSILNEFYTDTPKCQRTYMAWKYLDSLTEDESSKILTLVESRVPFICDGCGKDIKNLTSPFISRVEVYPSRNMNLDLNEYEPKDYEKEIYSAIEASKDKSEKELAHEMWTEYRLFLCPRCRNTFVKRIESGEFI